MVRTRSGLNRANMSQNSDGAGGAQQNAPAALNSLEQVQLINEAPLLLFLIEILSLFLLFGNHSGHQLVLN